MLRGLVDLLRRCFLVLASFSCIDIGSYVAESRSGPGSVGFSFGRATPALCEPFFFLSSLVSCDLLKSLRNRIGELNSRRRGWLAGRRSKRLIDLGVGAYRTVSMMVRK